MPWDSVDAVDLSVVLQTTSRQAFQTQEIISADDDGGQMLSLYARWVLPESGFETYLEWSRNERPLDLSDVILEPDHSRALVLGFTKAFASGVSIWRLRGEATNLERSGTFQVRPSPAYYVQPIALQGYTHRGQLLGAAIGPGGSSQFLGVDRYSPAGRIGIQVERVRYDNDAYYDRFGPTETYRGHDVETTLGLTALRFVGDFDLVGVLAASHELNRYYQVTNNVTNLRAEFTVGWRVR
jgi:hypothetical protein